jgi:thiamine-monophosphate kinase
VRLAALGEFGLIDHIARLTADTKPLATAGRVRLGIGDDAALLEIPPGRQVVATIDTLMEEVHFRREWTGAEDLGWKSLAVNVSDVAAMGSEPLAAFLSLALPGDTSVEWVEDFTRGLEACAREYGSCLAGGDTVRSLRHLAITVALLGTVERDRALLRSGARVGDAICVTGTLGDSAAGLALLMAKERGVDLDLARSEFGPLLEAHHRPRPRLAAARALAASGCVTAMLDLSDGLASDLRHLAARSGVGALIRSDALPVSESARAAGAALGIDPVDWALHGGEDYELLFTVAADDVGRVREMLGGEGVSIAMLGEIAGSGLHVSGTDATVQPLVPKGFAHFGTDPAED